MCVCACGYRCAFLLSPWSGGAAPARAVPVWHGDSSAVRCHPSTRKHSHGTPGQGRTETAPTRLWMRGIPSLKPWTTHCELRSQRAPAPGQALWNLASATTPVHKQPSPSVSAVLNLPWKCFLTVLSQFYKLLKVEHSVFETQLEDKLFCFFTA